MARTEFACLHCGRCCTLGLVQINLSFVDILRLGRPAARLFREGVIGFYPFFDPESLRYDVELGLSKPCKLHKDKRCSVYSSRPLNCRMFPYFLLSGPLELEAVFDEGFKCVHGLKLGSRIKARYRKYSETIGAVLLKEAERTEQALIRLRTEFGFFPEGIEAGMPGSIKDEERRLKLALGLIRQKLSQGLISRTVKLIEGSKGWVESAELEGYEKQLLEQ
jgi:Fe-S-cluster containining protein